jgi:aryl-phospho-beta-D-glucosidase BglC (GH1 family)
MKSFSTLFTPLLVVVFLSSCKNEIGPQKAVKLIGCGINLGNTLDPPDEGLWNNGPAMEYYFDDFKKAGFNSVRLPITWAEHIDTISPYTLNEAWLDRIEQIVDWGLKRDLVVIINSQHDSWVKRHYNEPVVRDRFDSLWSQVARRFMQKSPKLFFEIANEPDGMSNSQVNELTRRSIAQIRKTNPTRIIIISGYTWTNTDSILEISVPSDKYLVSTFHYFKPRKFTEAQTKKWGSINDINVIKRDFDAVSQWSKKNNIPVFISEFGGSDVCDNASRKLFYTTIVKEAIAHNFNYVVWDNGIDMAVYQRRERKWTELKEILLDK